MTTPSRCTRRIEDNNNIIEIPSYHYSLHPSLPASITSGRFDEWRVTTRIKKYNIRIIVVRLWSLRSLLSRFAQSVSPPFHGSFGRHEVARETPGECQSLVNTWPPILRDTRPQTKMQRLDWSLSRKVTQDIKTQPQINHYHQTPSASPRHDPPCSTCFPTHLRSSPSALATVCL